MKKSRAKSHAALQQLHRERQRLVERLKSLGLYGDTLLIVTSDHGEAFGEKGLLEHNVSVYQNQVHVPLIVKYPNSEEGRTIREVVSQIDVVPTVFAALGIGTEATLPGTRLGDVGRADGRLVFSDHFLCPTVYMANPEFTRRETAVVTGSLKFVESPARMGELYDLSEDPDERNDLYRQGHPAVARLRQALADWEESTPRQVTAPAKLDKKALERLKSLGYVR